jgi:hypothetical protein
MDRLRAHIERLNRCAALRRRTADLIQQARVLCDVAAMTQAESCALRINEQRVRDLAGESHWS